MATIEPRTARLANGVTCTIRTAVGADAPALLDHHAHMIATDPNTVTEAGEKQRTLEEQVSSIAAHREDPGQLLLVVIQGTDPQRAAACSGEGMLLGALAFRAGDRRKVQHHGRFGLSTHADWRGQGVGSALIASVLDWAAAHPLLEKVCLGVYETNTGARRLYDRLGFVQEHRSPMYFKLCPGRYVDGIWMAIYVKPDIAPAGFKTWRG